MTDKPITMNDVMVRALINGRKIQTRRIIKPQPELLPTGHWHLSGQGHCSVLGADRDIAKNLLSYSPWSIGDRLWVRETWAHYHTANYIRRSHGGAFSEVSDGLAGYRADGHDTIEDFRQHVRLMSGCDLEDVVINKDRWRPSIHMPRWASRLTLIVTDVRVERLQDISEEEAQAEGIERMRSGRGFYDPTMGHGAVHFGHWFPRATEAFRHLWDSLHGADAWAANSWVAVISFQTIRANVDTIAVIEPAA